VDGQQVTDITGYDDLISGLMETGTCTLYVEYIIVPCMTGWIGWCKGYVDCNH
jgi:hypothetical protein